MIRPENLSVVAFDAVLSNEPSSRKDYLPEDGQADTGEKRVCVQRARAPRLCVCVRARAFV